MPFCNNIINYSQEDIINSVLSYGSYFIDEGRELLSNEFGKDYGNYFSILSAVASGFNKRGEIKSYTGIEAGGYLEKLEKVYDIVYKYRPYLSSENSRSVKYGIKDNFLNFWFRFVYKYRSAVEIGNLDYVKDKVIADYETFSGWILERYFRQKYRETGMYNIVTNYWEKGGMNEIDIVAANDVDRKLVIAECKRNPNRVNLNILKNKAINIVQKRKNWHVDYIGLSLNDM